MQFIVNNIYILILLPLISAIIGGFCAQKKQNAAFLISFISVLISIIFGVYAFKYTNAYPAQIFEHVFKLFGVSFGTRLNSFVSLILLVNLIISALSLSYAKSQITDCKVPAGFIVYFNVILLFFNASVLAPALAQALIFAALTMLCSLLLIMQRGENNKLIISTATHTQILLQCGVFSCLYLYILRYSTDIFAPMIMKVFVLIGILAAIIFAFAACIENRTVKILTYSTLSLFAVVMAMYGLGSVLACVVVTVIHSFTKALLFACAGEISKTTNDDNINLYGGLRKSNPILSLYWWIGMLSLTGIFFGGFTMKEIIINTLKASGSKPLFAGTLVVLFFTVYFSFRLYFKLFEGNKEPVVIKMSRSSMFTIRVLALFVILPGFLFKVSGLTVYSLIVLLLSVCSGYLAYFNFKLQKDIIPEKLLNLFTKKQDT